MGDTQRKRIACRMSFQWLRICWCFIIHYLPIFSPLTPAQSDNSNSWTELTCLTIWAHYQTHVLNIACFITCHISSSFFCLISPYTFFYLKYGSQLSYFFIPQYFISMPSPSYVSTCIFKLDLNIPSKTSCIPSNVVTFARCGCDVTRHNLLVTAIIFSTWRLQLIKEALQR